MNEKRDDFARAMVVKMMSYALGRSLEFDDDDVVDTLTKRFKKQGYRLDRLIGSIATSRLFLER
jgi:hypothetical protein